jgi:capsular exopolysaccharide synthesis family protein
MLNTTSSKRTRDIDETRRYEPEYVTYNDVWLFIRRYATTIAICFVAAMFAASYRIYTTTPRYTTSAQILIDPNTTQVIRDTSAVQTQSLDTAQVESQIAYIRSESLAYTVIKKLKLAEDPEFQPGGPSAIKRVIAFLTRGFTSTEEPEATDYLSLRVALDIMLNNMDVRRMGPSYVISIGFTSTDPVKAANIANAIAETYIQEQLRAVSGAAQQGSELLEQRLSQLRVELNTAARQLEAFKSGRDFRLPQTPPGPNGANQPTMGPANQTQPGAWPSVVQDTPVQRDSVGLQTGARPATLAELEMNVENHRHEYETYQRAFTEALQRQSFPVSNARIITAASRPLGRSEPRSMLILAFGGMTGLLGGIAVAFLRHSLDNSVRSAKHIRQQVGLPCLALIPQLDKEPKQPTSFSLKQPSFPPPSSEPPLQTDNFRVVIDAPFSPFTGSLKALKTALTNADPRHPIRCVGVTSAMPGEGKSTVTANLAALYSTSVGRTLIIDADIHHSTISRHFAPTAQRGLLEVVTGAAEYDRAIKIGSSLAPDVLPIAPTEAPVSYDLLSSENMEALLSRLRDHYDMIIVDLPPVNPIVDSVAIGALLDGVVVVAEWGKTPIDVVSDVANVLYIAQANVLGVVINKVDKSMATVRWRKHWGYGYYRSHTGQNGNQPEADQESKRKHWHNRS